MDRGLSAVTEKRFRSVMRSVTVGMLSDLAIAPQPIGWHPSLHNRLRVKNLNRPRYCHRRDDVDASGAADRRYRRRFCSPVLPAFS
jgi:hypothetical protein